jgi:hypothetical protein
MIDERGMFKFRRRLTSVGTTRDYAHVQSQISVEEKR